MVELRCLMRGRRIAWLSQRGPNAPPRQRVELAGETRATPP